MPQKGISPKVFYGWWIVMVCFIFAMTSGIVGYGFTAFFNPIVQEFGWSYAAVSFAASLRGAETGILSPALGFLVDRWSIRWILLGGVIITAAGLVFFSLVSSLSQFYGAWIIIALGTSCVGTPVVNPAISRWFRRDLGKAMGILTTGFAISGLFVPVIYYLIESYGWREALVIIGISFLVICIPLIFVFKDRPEPQGYLPDGDQEPQKTINTKSLNPKTSMVTTELNTSTSQALKSRTFWHLTLAFTLQSIVYIAIVNHIMPYLNTVNVEASVASFFAGAIPLLSIAGRLGSGWLSDKFSRKQVAVASFAVACIGTLLFDYVRDVNIWLLVLTVIIFSVSVGSITTLRGVITIEYFGRSRFASIFGILIGIVSLGAMLGPVLAGWTFDIWGNYHYAWIIFTGLSIASLIFMATTPKIHREKAVTTSE